MRIWGVFAWVSLVLIMACSKGENAEHAASVNAIDRPGCEVEYCEADVEADDPRTRLRGALAKLGQDDDIPENASQQELEALVDEKVANGAIPKEHAEKLLKVLESAQQHNERLEQLDQRLFGENAY